MAMPHVSGLNFSAEEYEISLKVIRTVVNSSNEQLMHSSLKDLRKHGLSLAKAVAAKMPKHVKALYGLAEIDLKEVEKYRTEQWRKSQKRRDMDLDRKHTNGRTLRSERISNLKQLEKNAPLLDSVVARIPDGVGCPIAPATNNALCIGHQESYLGAKKQADNKEVHTQRPKACYICKRRFHKLHSFYDRLCPKCAALNFSKRNLSVDLTGRTFLVTGCRVKIGFHVCLKLLKSGATVIGTSRFPCDAAYRYNQLRDHVEWESRLHIYGLDFRSIESVESFAIHICKTYSDLNGIINNACQTVRRPAKYYQNLVDFEVSTAAMNSNILLLQHKVWERSRSKLMLPAENAHGSHAPERGRHNIELSEASRPPLVLSSAELSQYPLLPEDEAATDDLPEGLLDVNGQQLDLRKKNSWVLRMHEVRTPELVEVLAINTVAPFILNARLKPLLESSSFLDRYIVNVSAMEGKFYRFKGPEHPHTNMAKAALNMMTRTSAQDFVTSSIYMNSVDTGWINDENPTEKAAALAQNYDFQTPLDEIDAAARVVDPIMMGVQTGNPIWGKFLKDFEETEW